MNINELQNNIKPFINLLCKKWERFWDYIYLDSNYTEQKIKKYITYIIKYADIEDLVFFTNGSNINTYIIQQPDFLTFFGKSFSHSINNFSIFPKLQNIFAWKHTPRIS